MTRPRKRGRPPTPPAVLRERRRQRRAEGAQLKRRRRALGLTQEDVAQALGLHRQAVSEVERGLRRGERVRAWIEGQERGGNREGKGDGCKLSPTCKGCPGVWGICGGYGSYGAPPRPTPRAKDRRYVCPGCGGEKSPAEPCCEECGR